MPLVAASDFEVLPQEPEARWLQLRDLIETRLDRGFDMNNRSYETYDLLEYAEVLTAAAEELGIEGLKSLSPSNIHEDFATFRASVAALAARLSLRKAPRKFAHSVAIQRPTRKALLLKIAELRAIVDESELSQTKKRNAAKQIDQLHTLVISEQTDIAQVGIVLAGIGAFAVGTASLLADLPTAVGTISMLIGAEKQEEDDEKALIESNRKHLQIEDLRESSDQSASSGAEHNPSQQIPF